MAARTDQERQKSAILANPPCHLVKQLLEHLEVADLRAEPESLLHPPPLHGAGRHQGEIEPISTAYFNRKRQTSAILGDLRATGSKVEPLWNRSGTINPMIYNHS